MRMNALFLPVLAAVLLSACGGTSSGYPAGDSLHAVLNPSPATDSINRADSAKEELRILPQEVTADLFRKRNISLPSPFNADSAFKKLFPGRYYKVETPYPGGDTITLIAWSAHHTAQRTLPDIYDDQALLFPLKDSNETRMKDRIMFTGDDGKRNVLMSFSTTAFTTDLLPAGRFTCACFGLALFTEEGMQWNLRSFSPALGCYGSFQTIPAIHMIRFGKNNYGCYIDNTNGPAGGPFYTDLYVFGIVGGDFKLLMQRPGTGRIYDGKSEWKSELRTEGQDENFSELQVITAGDYYSKKNFDEAEDDTANTPGAIKNAIRSKEHFGFKIVSHYTFGNGAYIFKSEDLDLAPSKEEAKN